MTVRLGGGLALPTGNAKDASKHGPSVVGGVTYRISSIADAVIEIHLHSFATQGSGLWASAVDKQNFASVLTGVRLFTSTAPVSAYGVLGLGSSWFSLEETGTAHITITERKGNTVSIGGGVQAALGSQVALAAETRLINVQSSLDGSVQLPTRWIPITASIVYKF